MNTFYGKSVYDGIAIGRLQFWRKENSEIKKLSYLLYKLVYYYFYLVYGKFLEDLI